ncbi:uncharacterized protein LOC130362185 isoform X2 [Hyla sarda]|uniref:uncharacterized protein LOC130362185 isoform X2 n=1 Tax=Hyla sarda TaxID=327740 RepID=UPI0024C32EAF|nr:uncharacterized protein LOC130362185 isoform X2 [Hyla sarda]
MSEVYRISSSDKIQLLEKELATQLSELKTEIEENGVALHGNSSRAYSSVPIPKDFVYYRMEREMILKRGLQVAGAIPITIQADVMERELETCMRREYTADNLPLLLHQEQVGYIMQEYADSVQRAQRLSIARERLLTGQKNSINLITQEDLIIYMRWLICHLHSVKPIYNYIRVLQYLPISDSAVDLIDSHLKESINQKSADPLSTSSSSQNPSEEPALHPQVDDELPEHQTETEQIKPILRQLLSTYKIEYDTEKLKNTASEMELLTLVSAKFRSTFVKQETMRTFPMYDSGMETTDGWGFKGPCMAFKKISNWLPFVKIKPKRDPWQQKFLTKLKQHKKVDELLRQSQFTEITDAEKAMEVLQEHAARVLQPPKNNMVDPRGIFSVQQTSDKTTDIAGLIKRPGSSRPKKENGYNYQNTLQLLGLDEGEDNNKDPVLMKGAYLSLLYLRHLRLRDLQRMSLGILNYFRSIERTLTIDNCCLSSTSGNLLRTGGEQASWINASQGGTGMTGGLGSHQYMYQTPADLQVDGAQIMEFSQVENHNDFYTVEDGIVHTQDQRGAFVMYDAALKDLQQLQDELLLLTTLYIEKYRSFKLSQKEVNGTNLSDWAHINVDRLALLLELWTWECALLENKQQLVDSYYEAYQHTLDPEERFALAQVINDIMFRRPRFDIGSKYFLEAYKDECQCLRLYLQLVRDVLKSQLENQREFVQKVWHDGRKRDVCDFGLPPKIITKPLVSLNTSCPALKNVYLLEFHPSLGLAYLMSHTLDQICKEFQHICNTKTPKQSYMVEKKVLQLALSEWSTPRDLLKSFTENVHKDLFEELLIEDPVMVTDICMSALNSSDEDKKHGRGKQIHILDTFSKMLELITLRSRIIETSLETALLSRTYITFAEEMGFNQFHLHLRPVQFEFASNKSEGEQKPPMFITSLLEDDSCVDRYSPSSQLLAIHEVDNNQIGKFSFLTRESILQLLNKSGIENMQVVLACQVSQKNALLAANQLASYSYISSWSSLDMKEGNSAIQRQLSSSTSEKYSTSWAVVENQMSITPMPHTYKIPVQTQNKRLPEAFVSIQLEKVGPRDTMLNMFLQKRQAMGTVMRNPEEVEKVKRELVMDYCQKLSRRISTYSLRGQIIAYCNSLKQQLEEFPLICKTYFIIGHPQEKKTIVKEAPQADPRTFQERPHTLLSEDSGIFVNLWYIPHFSEVLSMFKMLPEKAAYRALSQTLQIIAALHDIVSYLLSFAQLGNSCSGFVSLKNKELTADWGGTEGIGAELRDVQKLIDGLQNPQDPKEVAALLLLRREVMILQFEKAVRYLIREALLSSGNISAFRTTTDNMYHGLTGLSNTVVKTAFSSQLPVPQPLDPHSHLAFLLYPWRTFLADGGLFPLAVHGLNAIGYHMQLCLCEMTDQERSVAHGELVGVHLLMEDILQGKYLFRSFTVEGNLETKQLQVELFPMRGKQSSPESTSQDPISESTLLKSFLILWKQMEVFKEQWGKRKLQVEEINTLSLYRQFCELYRDEIFYPTMKALAWQMGKEEEFEGITLRSQVVLPPKGASEIEVRVRQLQKIMESFETDMIHDVKRKIAKEMTLVISERAREGRGVPTELWKKPVMKENFSPSRPEIVEKFVQLLMSERQENATEVTFSKEHLKRCLTSMACDIMAREHSNFESYSMFYENLLQHEHQLLYQKEQELLANKDKKKKNEPDSNKNTDMSHELLIEITALRAKLQDVEEEIMTVKETIKKQVQDEYEALIRTLFATCVSLKSRIDGYHINMNKEVTEIISDVRKEGVDDMIRLKKKYCPGQNASALKNTMSLQEKLQDLRDENSQLQALVCKLKALNKWKIIAKEGQLREKLRNAEKESIQNKKEGLKRKLLAEQEVALLRQQLIGARTTLTATQAEASKVKQQLSRQKQLLNESEHRHSQETKKRQQLDSIKSASMDKMLKDIDEKEQRLRSLTEETERSSKIGQLQQSKMRKEAKQIKSQLMQERSFKVDAFQRVDELQSQVYDLETTSLRTSPGGMRKTSASLTSFPSRIHSAAPAFMSSETFNYNQETWDPLQYYPAAEANSHIQEGRRLQRPKTVPSRCRAPEQADSTSQAILTQLHELRISTK